MLPPDIPVTTPEVLTLPVDGAVLLHIPPEVASVRVVVAPAQTTGLPVIVPALGNELTVAI